MFAPHTRGSTGRRDASTPLVGVCPAHAGVYLSRETAVSVAGGLPRTRGGLPIPLVITPASTAFAPHTRGSTVAQFSQVAAH